MRAIVVYESHWGNTAAVARAIGEGIGPETRVLPTDGVTPEVLAAADLVIAGAPTMAFRLPTESMLAQVAKDPVLAAFRKQVDVAVPMPNYPEMSMVWSPVTTAMNTIVKKTATPKQAMDIAQKEVIERIASLQKK